MFSFNFPYNSHLPYRDDALETNITEKLWNYKAHCLLMQNVLHIGPLTQIWFLSSGFSWLHQFGRAYFQGLLITQLPMDPQWMQADLMSPLGDRDRSLMPNLVLGTQCLGFLWRMHHRTQSSGDLHLQRVMVRVSEDNETVYPTVRRNVEGSMRRLPRSLSVCLSTEVALPPCAHACGCQQLSTCMLYKGGGKIFTQ